MSEVITHPLWLQALQKKQADAFMQRGMPTRKEENWKYTQFPVLPSADADEEASKTFAKSLINKFNSLAQIVFVDGFYSAELSHVATLPEGVIFSALKQKIEEQQIKTYLQQDFDAKKHPFAALNTARFTDGCYLRVRKNTVLTQPIHIVFITTQEDTQVNPRNIYCVEDNAELALVEEYISLTNTLTNVVNQLVVGNNAKLHHYKIQNENTAALHIANHFVYQQNDSQVELFNVTKGAKISREDVNVNLTAQGAECHLRGWYALHHRDQHSDHHLTVEHVAAHGFSSMLYKGVLDKNARMVFNGKVHVHPAAHHINSYQANHNLLLSNEAEVNTKPELEIYADDVKCTHGATVGQLDAESLFYLRSRGIDKVLAQQVLLEAYADEVISKIHCAAVRGYIKKQVDNHVEL